MIAELLHISTGCATRWVTHAGADWSTYAANLAHDRDHQPDEIQHHSTRATKHSHS